MFTIDKFPVVIVAAPRTGSTALLKKIVAAYGLHQIIEPYMPVNEILHLSSKKQAGVARDRHTLSDFLKNQQDKFALKFMPSEISYQTPYPLILNSSDTYKIKLLRKNVDKQIASLYIATETSRYHQTTKDKIETFELPLKKLNLLNCMETICHANFICDNLPYFFDIQIYYEELGNITDAVTADGGVLTYTQKPINYDEIVYEARILLKNTQTWV